MMRCKTCAKPTLHIGPSTSHVLHLLISVATLGAWVPVWAIIHIGHSAQIACTVCGRKRGIFG